MGTKKKVIFCWNCMTDVKEKNIKYHKNHKIKTYDKDPRVYEDFKEKK